MSIKKILEKLFKSHCPECGGVMDCEKLDNVSDRVSYKCRDCGRRWG